MPGYLIWPAVVMSLAFLFYSTGVWAERLERDLRFTHVAAFWLGLAFDAYGTHLMNLMRQAGRQTDLVHGVTGAAAFGLMALHAIWASWTLSQGSADVRRTFHRYSLGVWMLWLVPYVGGMIAGMLAGAN
ncbi:MAG: HsmA family protein [Coriobacteriia bacterium]